MAITGNGATVVFTTSGIDDAGGFAGRITSISEHALSLDSILDNDITTTVDQYIAGDTVHHEEITLGLVFDPDGAAVPTLGVVEDITITYQIETAGNTAASLAGDGFLTGVTIGEQANNQRVEGSVTFRWTGKQTDGSTATGPLFTVETT